MINGVILAFLGLVGIIFGIKNLMRVLKIKKWPTAAGKLISKSVEVSQQAAAKGPSNIFEVKVSYSYQVDGKTYTGKNIFPGHQMMQKADAEAFSAEISQELQVKYNPQNPEEAYLFPSSIAWPILAISCGVVCLVLGASLIINT